MKPLLFTPFRPYSFHEYYEANWPELLAPFPAHSRTLPDLFSPL